VHCVIVRTGIDYGIRCSKKRKRYTLNLKLEAKRKREGKAGERVGEGRGRGGQERGLPSVPPVPNCPLGLHQGPKLIYWDTFIFGVYDLYTVATSSGYFFLGREELSPQTLPISSRKVANDAD